MLQTPTIVESIPLSPPLAAIYSRLGFKKRTTVLSSTEKRQTDQSIARATSLIALRGSFLRLSILDNDGRTIRFDGNWSFESVKLAVFLGDCREAALLGATAGSNIMDAIRNQTSQDDFATAVVYDATASEMTDRALDWLSDYINRQLRREVKHLSSRRFSAGYADFALENQKIFHEKLSLAQIGVGLTESFLLTPEKSVTAISGILP